MALRKARLKNTLSISAKNNNKVFRIEDNEVFTEDQINNFDELLAGDFIELVVSKELKEVTEETPEPKKIPKSKSKK